MPLALPELGPWGEGEGEGEEGGGGLSGVHVYLQDGLWARPLWMWGMIAYDSYEYEAFRFATG